MGFHSVTTKRALIMSTLCARSEYRTSAENKWPRCLPAFGRCAALWPRLKPRWSLGHCLT